MADVELPPKYTRRSVSAVRQWPRGCGRIVAAAPSRPSEPADLAIAAVMPPPPEPTKIQEEAIAVPGHRCPDSSSAKEEEMRGYDSRKQSAGEVTVCMVETPELAKKAFLKKCISPAVAEPPPLDGAAEQRCYSKLYPPPMRRRVSAVRQFPPGCGRKASGVLGFAAITDRAAGSEGKSSSLDPSHGGAPIKKESLDIEAEDEEDFKSRRRKKMKVDSGITEDCSAQEGNSPARRSPAFAARKSAKKGPSDAKIEEKDASFISGDGGDETPEAAGERLVVQALMASQTCIWRRRPQRRSVAASSPSSEKKVAVSNTRTRRSSSSMAMNTIASATDLEDGAGGEDSNRALVVVYGGKQQPGSGGGEASFRHRVKRALRLFQAVFRRLTQHVVSKKLNISRIDLEASNILKKNNEYVHQGTKIIGDVPGVEVGDEFHYRVELAVVGLHGQLQGCIDQTDLDGVKVAISVVSSGGYLDGSNVLVFTGSGGATASDKQGCDQKLEGGNIALKNSIEARNPVRVIYGFKEKIADHRDSKAKMMSTFTYDGLYSVERFWQELGPHGFLVYKYQLRRQPGQPETGKKVARNSKVREGLVLEDVSFGKEIMPIPVVNTVDGELPPPFKYTTEVIYPASQSRSPQATGCECVGGCSDSHKCACAVKNGGELPFNSSGAIVEARRLVYECGPACGCPPSCQNRVSQKGIRIPLEIFKTASKGWGVRSLQSIASGSFICEYTAEMLRDEDSEKRINDEYLFDIGNNYDDNKLWEGIPTLSPEELREEGGGPSAGARASKEDGDGYTLDAAEYGNVGRFINHCCSPNLYAQNVLYDDDDKRTPHIMFFAADNIPPLEELTYHYNYGIDEVRDSQGNIKTKNCYCGASDCEGRLY